MAIKIVIDKNSMDASLDTNLLITEVITGTHVDKAEAVKAIEGLPTTIESNGISIIRKNGGMEITMDDTAVTKYNHFMVKWMPTLAVMAKAVVGLLKAYARDYRSAMQSFMDNLKYDGVPAE